MMDAHCAAAPYMRACVNVGMSEHVIGLLVQFSMAAELLVALDMTVFFCFSV